MTREEAVAELQAVQVLCDQAGDFEPAHVKADGVLRRLLISLGYEDVVAEYDKVGKWYG